MTLDLVIPTLNRREKLINCLNSIFHSAKNISINLYVYFSIKKDYEEAKNFFKEVPHVYIKLLDSYRVPDFWNSHMRSTKADAICYINDDILFYEDTVAMILDEYPKRFPDYDGVLGLRQANLPQDQAVEGAFGVIGMKYADRFPDRQVFCPDYDRFFGDFELWQYSKSIGKFYFCSIARIEHLHPVTDRTLEDDTHREVRKWIAGDKRTSSLRKSKNLLWGRTLELIH